MQLFYSDTFVLPLPENHRFPMDKYSRLRQRLMDTGLFRVSDFRLPDAATDSELLLAHTPEYLTALKRGSLDKSIARRIGFPWSPEMVERSRRSVGATIGAARHALVSGCGINLAGGTHHAYANTGGGFCVFNDTVVGARVLQESHRINRALVVDLDVHQGDGTAAITEGDRSIFTFSMHGAKNYPARKQTSDLDIALPSGTGDDEYLEALRSHLPKLVRDVAPDMIFYLAGADPYVDDRYGLLELSKEGLRKRDAFVFSTARNMQIPVTVAMAGGYAKDVDDIVDIHCATVLEAAQCFRPRRASAEMS